MSHVASTSGRCLNAAGWTRSPGRSKIATASAPRSHKSGSRTTRAARRSPHNPICLAESKSAKEVGFHVGRMRATAKPARPPPSLLPSLSVKEATSEAELRAASFLRARSFYVYPPEREFAGKIHQTVKAQEEYDALLARKAAMERELRENPSPRERAAALVALAPADTVYYSSSSSSESSSDPQAVERDDDLVIHSGDPSSSSSSSSSDLAVVGTLDVVAARAVDGEVLLGGGASPAYLANVCVSAAGRRRGVGAALISTARSLARSWGCDGLFVHSLAVNEVAGRFYLGLGFVVEVEEGAAEAARRGHCLDGVEGLGRSVLYRDATF